MIEINHLIRIFVELGKDHSGEDGKYYLDTELTEIEWLDSLGWTLLYNALEDEIKCSLPIDELLACQNIKDIFLLINSNGSK